HGEAIQILKYEIGQKYDAHFDYFFDAVNTQMGGHRVATVLMYLTTVEEGGETVFPSSQGDGAHVSDHGGGRRGDSLALVHRCVSPVVHVVGGREGFGMSTHRWVATVLMYLTMVEEGGEIMSTVASSQWKKGLFSLLSSPHLIPAVPSLSILPLSPIPSPRPSTCPIITICLYHFSSSNPGLLWASLGLTVHTQCPSTPALTTQPQPPMGVTVSDCVPLACPSASSNSSPLSPAPLRTPLHMPFPTSPWFPA
ncbi:unnamed protein product, partial [Closterium sp. NIES-53]